MKKNVNTYRVLFGAGESRNEASGASVNFMVCKLGTHEKSPWYEDELYAECEIKGNPDTDGYDDFEGFDELKEAIIEQAEEFGIDENQLEYTW